MERFSATWIGHLPPGSATCPPGSATWFGHLACQDRPLGVPGSATWTKVRPLGSATWIAEFGNLDRQLAPRFGHLARQLGCATSFGCEVKTPCPSKLPWLGLARLCLLWPGRPALARPALARTRNKNCCGVQLNLSHFDICYILGVGGMRL